MIFNPSSNSMNPITKSDTNIGKFNVSQLFIVTIQCSIDSRQVFQIVRLGMTEIISIFGEFEWFDSLILWVLIKFTQGALEKMNNMSYRGGKKFLGNHPRLIEINVNLGNKKWLSIRFFQSALHVVSPCFTDNWG